MTAPDPAPSPTVGDAAGTARRRFLDALRAAELARLAAYNAAADVAALDMAAIERSADVAALNAAAERVATNPNPELVSMDISAARAAPTDLHAVARMAVLRWLGRYLPQPDPAADRMAAGILAALADANCWPQPDDAPTWGGVVGWLAALADADAIAIAADVDAGLAAIGWPNVAGTVGGALQLRRPDGPPWPWRDVPPTLPDTWAEAVDTAYRAALADGRAPPNHPLRPLFVAYAAAHQVGVAADKWAHGTIPRYVTAERAGELARLELADDAANAPAMAARAHLPGLGRVGALASAPALAYLPGFAPADVPGRIIPASWLRLIDELARTERDTRDWQRALRLLIEVVSHPDPRERRGPVVVTLPVGGADGIVRRLWPNDGRMREHFPALRRALGLVTTAALPVDGTNPRAFLPARLARWQRPDALTFDVIYPVAGGGGAAFDRDLFRRYGPSPHLFRVYLAAVWALDARHLRRGRDGEWHADVSLDALAGLAAYPNAPADHRQRDKARRGTLAALERLAVDGALAYDAAGRGRRRRLALWRPRLALPPDDAPADCG